MLLLALDIKRKLRTSVALAAVACLSGSVTAAGASLQPAHLIGAPTLAAAGKTCPSPQDMNAALAESSELMQHARYGEAAAERHSFSGLHCDPRADLLLAAAVEGAGDTPKAEAVLQKALAHWPSNDSIATSLAHEYLSAGQVKEAARALEHFHATNKTPWQEVQLGVVVYMADHQLVRAETLAQTGYKTYSSMEALLLLANVLQLEGRYKDVIALLGGKRSTYPDSAAFLVTIAESEYDAAMYDVAKTDVDRAISLENGLYAAHYLLGNILLKQGDAKAAAAEYRLAIQIAPDQPRTYYYLALALRADHDEDNEESLLVKAISLDSSYALAHCEMGRILLNKNQLDEAVTQLNLAVNDNASSEQAFYLLARAYSRLGDRDKAEEMTKRLAAVRNAKHLASPGEGLGAEDAGHAPSL